MAPAFGLLARVAPEKPAKPTAVADARRVQHHLGGFAHDLVGALERRAVGELERGDQIALVLRRNESAGHGCETRTTVRRDQARR